MKKIFYRVAKFDTLSKIENKFNIPKSKMIFDNNLKGEVEEGDLLVLNILDLEYYTVSPFDSMESIEKNFCMETGEVYSINNIEYIYPFQNIWVKKKLL